MESKLLAASPQNSATVMASAGTGKTWLLVTRLVRLLLEGAAPDSILAITFTRKAAAEMAARLTDRLYGLSVLAVKDRMQALREMGIEPTESLLHNAASLYEKHLFEPRHIRITTFHAFCQELLRRFPLEADVPAGFEVLEGSRLLEEAAWDGLVDEATCAPDGPVAQCLEDLFQRFNGHQGTKAALMQFLDHRSDWWSYTLGESEPVNFAYRTLAEQLALSEGGDPLSDGLTPPVRIELLKYAKMLLIHGTATIAKAAAHIEESLIPERSSEDRLESLNQALLKKSATPKPSKALAKSLGEDGQDLLIAMHDRLRTWFLDVLDQHRRRQCLNLSHAWFRAGNRLLDQYQRLKMEQRVLDFSDLEWKAYLLLNHADHALWVQYKLDQRIDHLLVDEFQDTNPTQWHLIFPLLQELASGDTQRQRTVFLVGDAKQSIYRFRRAEPELFPAAQQWLHKQLSAVNHALSASWRSSPAIIDFVNRIFGKDPLRTQLTEFREHSTHREALWGQVKLLPLISDESRGPALHTSLRNPLHQSRTLVDDRRHRNEGQAIAVRIHDLFEQATIVGDGMEARPIRYSDIMILVRHRTHVDAYEEALRMANIPYITASRGTLLGCIEIGDVVALLQILIIPFNNLSLATVLRSPLFDCSEEDLMMLAAEPGDYWLERLFALSLRLDPGTPLARAAYWLSRWQILAGQRPVHDLLDRIYSEGNVAARFEAALPEHLRPRVRANLTRFIELALETDSGRYPSLTTFLQRLAILKAQDDDAPDEGTETTTSGSVRILTIHAAKGLEAPVVFLADSASTPSLRRAHQTVVRWPAHADRPSHFLLCGKPSEADSVTNTLLEEEARQEQREQINLLYVAITRAKQLLFISGCKPNRGEELGWYGMIAAQLGDIDTIQNNGWSISSGTPPPPVADTLPPQKLISIDPRLTKPVPLLSLDIEIAPSRNVAKSMSSEDAEGSRERGIAIHRFLQLLSSVVKPDINAIRQRVIAELALDENISEVKNWQVEAEYIATHPAFREWFDPDCYDAAFNEVPIYYYKGTKLVHGVVDRLVIKGDTCAVIDYKTHSSATLENLAAIAAPYHEQLRLYTEGIKKLWPDKTINSFLLFTACAGIHTWHDDSALSIRV